MLYTELVQLVLMLFLKEVTCFLIVFFNNRTLCSAAQENIKKKLYYTIRKKKDAERNMSGYTVVIRSVFNF